MTSPADVLALYDTASAIDRLRFHLRSQSAQPGGPSVEDVTGQVRTLAAIIISVSDEVSRHAADLHPAPAQHAALIYSSVLPMLGEGLTELGRLHMEVTGIRIPAMGHGDPSFAYRSAAIITGCLEAADEILDEAAIELRTEAAYLKPASAHMQDAARARSPHAPIGGRVVSPPAVPPAPVSLVVAPTTAKVR
ncbi:hypothetical protein [Streptomyces sp. CA-111067]|uniref:hypothetical protein n=1 Tax=Streptomyces sp. CA-111067 TaxID=3240046 RepID=UPI003D981C18